MLIRDVTANELAELLRRTSWNDDKRKDLQAKALLEELVISVQPEPPPAVETMQAAAMAMASAPATPPEEPLQRKRAEAPVVEKIPETPVRVRPRGEDKAVVTKRVRINLTDEGD